VGDAVSYTVVMALFAPNAALLGAAYLVGPGFAFGAGTAVSPTAVSLGVVPAFPLLAALPDEGPTPGWLVVLLAVPALGAGLGIARVLSRRAPTGYDVAAIRGALAGLAAGVVVTLLIGLSGGALGNGRMADIGAPFGEVLVFATGLMCLGSLVGAVGQNWWRRRGGWEPPADDEDELTVEVRRDVPAAADRPDDGDEPTVEVLR